jgi:hypothetical protein
MLVQTEELIKNWWAEGDIPVHTTSRVVYLVDGRSAMLNLLPAFSQGTPVHLHSQLGYDP